MMRRDPGVQRRLVTVLFTDIVGSTELAASLGDRAWRERLAQHHALVRRLLRNHHGREVDTAGDGFFAVFAAPADACRCALAITSAVAALDLQVRAGIHTGEAETSADRVQGIAVHAGARIAATAGPGEVVVSRTVHDLVIGSGLEFRELGVVTLKGVPGDWQLFTAIARPAADGTAPDDPASDRESARAPVLGRRTRWLAVGAAAALLMSGLAVALAVRPGSAPPGATPGPDTVVAVGAIDWRLAGAISVGRGPAQIVSDGGSLWVANHTDRTLSRADPSTLLGAPPLGDVGVPSSLAAGLGQVWVADRFSHVVRAIDPLRDEVTDRLDGLGAVASLAVGAGSLWVTDDRADLIVRVEPTTRLPVATIVLPPDSEPGVIAVGSSGVWVANRRSRTVSRVDPSTDAVVRGSIGLCCRPSAIAIADDGSVWVVSREGDTVQRLDGATGDVVGTIELDDDPAAITADRHGIWVAHEAGGTLSHLGPDGTLLARIGLPGAPRGVTVLGEWIWVTLGML